MQLKRLKSLKVANKDGSCDDFCKGGEDSQILTFFSKRRLFLTLSLDFGLKNQTSECTHSECQGQEDG